MQSSASAFSNGRDLFIVKAHLLDSGRLYSHEYTHVIDQSVLMNGLGRRANAGAETFAIGMFEQYFTDGNLDVNLSANFDKSKLISTNWTPERVNSPEKFQDFYHKLFQVLDLLDYLQGQAFLKLDQTTQSFVGRLNSGNTPSYDPNDPGKVRVFERLSPAKYAGIIQKPTSLADLINDKLGMYPGEDRITAVKRNDYSSPSIYDANWYEGHYDAGVADSLAVQYIAFQMAGEAGYQDGMLKVITGNRTDLELLGLQYLVLIGVKS